MPNSSKQTNPLQGIFTDIKKILEYTEIKNNEKAKAMETQESQGLAEVWINAMMQKDTYLTYRQYWTISMFLEVNSMANASDIKRWISAPYTAPVQYHENLLVRGREAFLNSYEESNNYYRTLNGLPPVGATEKDFIYISEKLRNQLHASDDPIHLLSPLIQNSYMATEEYQKVLKNNPDKEYLKYLGYNKIDILTARTAKDFEIIRYPLNRSDINPYLLNEFSSLYADYREYVVVALYNSQLEGLYKGYRSFMGMIIMFMTLMQIANRATEKSISHRYLDDSSLYMILSMYGIPDDLLLTTEVRRKLVASILKLVKEKGTNSVYYDLIQILGYQDVVINKLMLVKNPNFVKNKAVDGADPYFIEVGLTEKDLYSTMTSGDAKRYDYHTIIDEDPTWWDLPDTREPLLNNRYSITDTKYITIEGVIHQVKYLMESVYFTKLITDNKSVTDELMIEVPEIFGTEQMSIYDLMIFVMAATCMSNNMSGEINSDDTRLLAAAGFNFDLDVDTFKEYLDTTKYVDKDRVLEFMKDLTVKEENDINRIYNDVMCPMRDWLEYKMTASENREEFIEYESIYRALYTYDASINRFLQDFETPMETICKKYDISDSDMIAYQHFYPRTLTGKAITVDEYETSRYKSPFIDDNNIVDWWIHIAIDTPQGVDDRGYVYFHDILNCDDLRTLTNPDGLRVFMDYEDGEVGWQINQQAVEKAISLIDALDSEQLSSARFQVAIPGTNSYSAGEHLPASIRAGIFKDILKDKIRMDMEGMAEPPITYQEYLYRKNRKLYNLLTENNRYETNREAWLNDVMTIVTAIEGKLNLQLKYFEQSVGGRDLFFRPLIALIKHFKSTYASLAKTGLKYVFGDKVDAGGNSNMFKLFDEVEFVIHFVTLANRGYSSQFGFFDTEHRLTHSIILKDKSKRIRRKSGRLGSPDRDMDMGSIHLTDEVKFTKNGDSLTPGKEPAWETGEPDPDTNYNWKYDFS